MSDDLVTKKSQELNPYFAKVIGFVNQNGQLDLVASSMQYDLLINVGKENDVKVGERVLVFALGSELTDPDEGASLGHFEIVRGEGRVSGIQTKMAVITSSRVLSERYLKPTNHMMAIAGIAPEQGNRDVPAPFRAPVIGDLVRFI